MWLDLRDIYWTNIQTEQGTVTKGRDIHQSNSSNKCMKIYIISYASACFSPSKTYISICWIYSIYKIEIYTHVHNSFLLFKIFHYMLGALSIWRDPSTHSCIDWGSNFSPFSTDDLSCLLYIIYLSTLLILRLNNI